MLISGTSTNAITSIPTTRSSIQRQGLRLAVAIPVAGSLMSLHQMKGATPPGLVEEMKNDMPNEGDTIGDAGALVLVLGGDKRPIHKERAADDVLTGNKAPVTAVEAVGAVVSHGEVAARRHNQIAILNVIRQIERPFGGYVT